MTDTAGEGLLAELRWVHDMLRRDLAICRQLALDISDGASASFVRSAVEELQTRGPLWQLRVNCLQYCAHVHGHHNAESALLFPAVRATDPARMSAVVDRLEADHRKVSDLLDEVEAAAREMTANDAAERRRLAGALTQLSDHLLDHLAYEEESIGPILRTWSRWPHQR